MKNVKSDNGNEMSMQQNVLVPKCISVIKVSGVKVFGAAVYYSQIYQLDQMSKKIASLAVIAAEPPTQCLTYKGQW